MYLTNGLNGTTAVVSVAPRLGLCTRPQACPSHPLKVLLGILYLTNGTTAVVSVALIFAPFHPPPTMSVSPAQGAAGHVTMTRIKPETAVG